MTQSDSRRTASGAVRYSRTMRQSWAVALGISATLGIGVFAFFGQAAQLSGVQSIAAPFLLVALVAAPLILTFGERAAVVAGRDGAYNLARTNNYLWQAFGTGWLLFGGYIFVTALLGLGVAHHVNLVVTQLLGLPQLDNSGLAALSIGLFGIYVGFGSHFSWRRRSNLIYAVVALVLIISLFSFFVEPPDEPVSAFYSDPSTLLEIVGLLVSTLWGLHLVLATRDEIRHPTRTLVPALIYTVLIGIGVASAAALAIDRFPYLLTHPVTPLFDLAVHINANSGLLQLLYVVAALTVLFIALQRVISNSVRLIGAINRDGFLPSQLVSMEFLGRRPSPVLLLFVLLAMVMALLYPLRVLAAVASILFLWIVVLVHISDLFRSRPNLPETRRLKLPFHPLFPGISIAIGLLLPFVLGQQAWWIGGMWLGIGALVYVFYAGGQGVEARNRTLVVGDEMLPTEAETVDYSVLAGIVDWDEDNGLIEAGSCLARLAQSGLLVLKTVSFPEQMPAHLKQDAAREEWTALTDRIAQQELGDLPVRAIVRIAADPADGILDAIVEQQIDLVLVGWRGSDQADERTPDDVVNKIVRYARCDVAVLRGAFPTSVHRALAPTAGGPHAPLALRLGQALAAAADGEVQVVTVVSDEASAEEYEEARRHLDATLGTADGSHVVDRILQVEDEVERALVTQSQNTDLLLIGASKEGAWDRSYFGGLATRVAFSTSTPTILTRIKEEHRSMPLIRMWDAVHDALPALLPARREVVSNMMRESAVPTVDFFVLIVLAAGIASLGLLQNSAAVIIGAMLVAPLMSPILATAMGMVLGEFNVVRLGVESTVKGLVLAIFVGIAAVIVSPIDAPTNEILARTEPNVLDLMVALVSGAAAGYAMSRTQVAAALPGVAISAALVPPLCVVGYGIGISDFSIALGALLLFVTNLIAIIFAAALVFLALGFRPPRGERGSLMRGLRITIISLVAILAVLMLTTYITVSQLNLRLAVEEIFEQQVVARAARVGEIEVTRERDGYLIAATVIAYEDTQLTPEEIRKIEEEITDAVDDDVTLNLTIIEAARTDLQGFDTIVEIESLFEGAMVALGVEIDKLSIDLVNGIYFVEAQLITLEDDDLTESNLLDVQSMISQETGSAVELDATILYGLRTELKPIPTAEP